MKINIRLQSVLRVALLIVVIGSLFWYVSKKRAEWEQTTRPLRNTDNATAVMAPIAPATRQPAPALSPSQDGEGFALARLERDRVLATQEEDLRDLASDASLPEASRRDAAAKLTALAERQAKEAELEQLLRQKGFADALVTLGEGNGRVLLRSQAALSPQQLAQIADAARQVAGLKPWQLSVLTRP